MLRPRLSAVIHEGSRPLDRRRPRRLSAGASSLSTVLCWCQCLRLKLDGDDHGDLPSGRERSIREQAVDRNNSGQDISHLVDGDGRRTVREERNRLRLQDDGAVEFNCVYHLSLIHISEPTRLGMISYAVFCLKKKKNKTLNNTT